MSEYLGEGEQQAVAPLSDSTTMEEAFERLSDNNRLSRILFPRLVMFAGVTVTGSRLDGILAESTGEMMERIGNAEIRKELAGKVNALSSDIFKAMVQDEEVIKDAQFAWQERMDARDHPSSGLK